MLESLFVNIAGCTAVAGAKQSILNTRKNEKQAHETRSSWECSTSLAAEAAEAAGLKLFLTVFKEFPLGNGVLAIFIQYFLNPKDYFNSTPDQMNEVYCNLLYSLPP
jgi:hypothetical protein